LMTCVERELYIDNWLLVV